MNMQELEEQLSEAKYGEYIREILPHFYQPWMNDLDKADHITHLFDKGNTSIAKIDDDIEIGVQNGYSPELQIGIIKNLFRTGSVAAGIMQTLKDLE